MIAHVECVMKNAVGLSKVSTYYAVQKAAEKRGNELDGELKKSADEGAKTRTTQDGEVEAAFSPRISQLEETAGGDEEKNADAIEAVRLPWVAAESKQGPPRPQKDKTKSSLITACIIIAGLGICAALIASAMRWACLQATKIYKMRRR